MGVEQAFIPYTAETCPPPGNVLVLAPHPDDEVFACGGAIMRHVAQNDEVHCLLATDGSAAIVHENETAKQAYIQLRRQESVEAAKVLAYQHISHWDIADRALVFNEKQVAALLKLIHDTQATRVYAPSLHEIHPDHYALAQIACAAVSRCGAVVTLCMYEVGVPLNPNYLLDITDLLEKKHQAIHCFVSQLQLNDYTRHMESLNAYRCYTLPAHITAAEAFFCLDGETLKRHPELHYGSSRQSHALQSQKGLAQYLKRFFN
ncbi:PIG-L family deacetylase [Candidatus Venteria ishoeyi]|uniref:PIG-L deacetylase family protein n=1 Tax=Candidatus Venteria ishoeyi TaxID=1899563 RepID=UPI0025A505EF|nr:PIG-L family deacetylase [Candidatus Venteria ishoeyi]MDM8546470.1 PIG-L family deacetylase [Candidatus Venteria ishoeyi]